MPQEQPTTNDGWEVEERILQSLPVGTKTSEVLVSLLASGIRRSQKVKFLITHFFGSLHFSVLLSRPQGCFLGLPPERNAYV